MRPGKYHGVFFTGIGRALVQRKLSWRLRPGQLRAVALCRLLRLRSGDQDRPAGLDDIQPKAETLGKEGSMRGASLISIRKPLGRTSQNHCKNDNT